jgi:hypothetical protein
MLLKAKLSNCRLCGYSQLAMVFWIFQANRHRLRQTNTRGGI